MNIIDPNEQVKVPKDLLVLERGRDELLLADNMVTRPLYVKEGRQYILKFLASARKLGTRERIIAAYPHEETLVNLLLDSGIIVPQAANGQNRPRPLDVLSSVKKRQMSLYLLASQSCNMNCVYCLNGRASYQTDKNLKMDRTVAFRSIDRCLEDISEDGRLEIIFFGGEPLLNWPLAKDAILHCEKRLGENHKGKQRQYHFTSNLSFLPGDLIEWARKYDISFLCDIDGPPDIHNRARPFRNGGGTYESTVRSIEKMLAAGLKIDFRATITSLNQDHLFEIAELHKALGGNSSGFVPVTPVNSDQSLLPDELLPSIEKIISGMTDVYRSKLWERENLYPFNQYAARFRPGYQTPLGCGAAYGNLPAVAANGDVYPCIYLVGIRKFHLGNIRDAGYPQSELVGQLFDSLHVDSLEGCKRCPWRYLCGGGCPLGRLTVTNNPAATTKVESYCKEVRCDLTKSVLELLLWEKADETASCRNGTLDHTLLLCK